VPQVSCMIYIKEFILDGRLDEDSRLTEEFLSTQLGISKSPIRDALNRLEAEGLIRIEPRKGAHLRRLSTEEVTDLYDLREALETVRTAKLTPAFIADFRQSHANARSSMPMTGRTTSKKRALSRAVAASRGKRAALHRAGEYPEPALAFAPQYLRPFQQ
jgi:DNA-binding FadR family transcriptional regulator